MEYKYKASIIVLTYNHFEYIDDALNSVEMQGIDSVQVVVGDDCSTDGTQELVKKISNSSRLDYIVFLNKKNLGITENFNRCLSSCEGEYIFLLGGDDLFLEGKLERQISFMDRRPEVYISYHDAYVFESSSGKILTNYSKLFNVKDPSIESLILSGTFFTGCTPCVRNFKNIPLCNKNIKFSSDWLWYIEVLIASNGKLAEIDGVYSKYRRHSGNVTAYNNHMTAFSETMYSLDYISDNYNVYRSLVIKAKSERLFAFFIKFIIAGKIKLGFKLLLKSIRSHPLGILFFIKMRFNSISYRLKFK